MIRVRVVGVAVDARSQPVILLQPTESEPHRELFLPIWIGAQEATSIVIAVEGAEAPRPLAHDLMKSMLATLSATVEQVAITRIDDGTFYAEVTLQAADGPRVLDSRPSDAIALASRTDAPVWVAEEVLLEVGIPAEATGIENTEEKIDEFKRFLDDVDPEDFQG